LKNIDFSGKKVAIYSTGDQESYPDTFVDSIGILADVVEAKGAKIVGYTEVEGYNFNESKGQRDGKFIGLAIDDNNQSSLTEERVKKWIETLKGEF
jgi:flavodoxin I